MILAGTWSEGLFALDGADGREQLGKSITGLTSDASGGVLAIVGGKSLCRRSSSGEWSTLATSARSLSACAALRDAIFVGTDDARVLRLEREGTFAELSAFNSVAGRETWYAGGPPLGVRSMAATCDGSALLVNVHVGGIPRSSDAGQTWRPTLAVESDAHQVAAHPDRPELVAAATAQGLALSRDGGETWRLEREGLHASHCLAVAFVGDEVWVSAAPGPFSDGAVFRRRVDEVGPLQRLRGGVLPQWFEGGVDTGNLAARGDTVAIADRAGHLYLSRDCGATWELLPMVPGPSGLLIL